MKAKTHVRAGDFPHALTKHSGQWSIPEATSVLF